MEKRIEDYIVYDETSSTCLRWIKKPSRQTKVGDEAFTYVVYTREGCTNYYGGNFNYKQRRAHPVVWYLHHGVWSDRSNHINHKDGNGLNNKIDNLELISSKENWRHSNRKLNSNNTTGVRGISPVTDSDKYAVYRNKKVLGYVDSIEEGKELLQR